MSKPGWLSWRLCAVGLCLLAEASAITTLLVLVRLRWSTVYGISEALGIVLAIAVLNRNDAAEYRFAWAMLLLLAPPLGCVLYTIRGGRRVWPRVARRMRRLEAAAVEALPVESATQHTLADRFPEEARQAAYLTKASGFPPWRGTQVAYVTGGAAIHARLTALLAQATQSLYLEFFIVADGMMWEEIHTILKEKAREGVDVRVMFDAFGTARRQPRGFRKRLEKEGIRVGVFNPLRPQLDLFLNNRDHRKIVVADGQIAMTGSFNIGDEYLGTDKRCGDWVDGAVVMTGSAVQAMTATFLTLWSFVADTDFAPPLPSAPVEATGVCQPYCDSPFRQSRTAQGLLWQMLRGARRYVWLSSPYLILDSTTVSMLTSAAQAGVDVRILTPAVRDKWYVHPVTRSFYAPLLATGVRLFEYTPGFNHAKLCVCDDTVATVGTVNLDFRSFYFHFENGVWLCDAPAVQEVKRHWETMASVSREITPKWLEERPKGEKFLQRVLRVLAPFL